MNTSRFRVTKGLPFNELRPKVAIGVFCRPCEFSSGFTARTAHPGLSALQNNPNSGCHVVPGGRTVKLGSRAAISVLRRQNWAVPQGDHPATLPGMRGADLSTFAGLLDHGHELACWCPGCRRWASCDLAMLVRNGLGERRITECRPRCRLCGSRGEWQVRPRVPQLGKTMWMQRN